MTLDVGFPATRPIGMWPIDGPRGVRFGFRPQALVLTYDAAIGILGSHVLEHGPGVVSVRYQDDPRWMEGDYTLYLLVERVGMERPCEDAIASRLVSGSATLTTTHGADGDRARGPFNTNLDLTFTFKDCRTHVEVNLPPIFNPPFNVDLPAGTFPNTTVVTQIGGGVGTFDPTTGQLSISVTLQFSHSLATDGGPDPADPTGVRHRPGIGTALAGPSTISLTLTTDAAAGGSRLRAGHVVLAGTGHFMRGYLGGSDGTIVVRGDLSPSP